jgi:hypothetical protein
MDMTEKFGEVSGPCNTVLEDRDMKFRGVQEGSQVELGGEEGPRGALKWFSGSVESDVN